MKVAIVGAGGVGGYYGALLAKAGHEVTFLARGAHGQAIRERGLCVRSVCGDFTVSPARATDNPAEIGPVDLVLVAVKTYHLDEVAKALPPLIHPETVVLPLENGVDATERLAAVVGWEPLVGGVTWISAAIEEPGVIVHFNRYRRIAFGEWDGRPSARTGTICEALQGAEIQAEISEDIRSVQWTKMVFIASVSAVGSLTRAPFGDIRSVPETRAVLVAAMGEIAAVARARGARLESDIIETSLSIVDGSTTDIKTSLQRDIEAGRLSELDSMIGVVVRLGAETGVPTPVMGFAYAMLKPGYLKAREVWETGRKTL